MKQFLLVSDFDQTLSFNDSGLVLSEMLGIGGFVEKTAGLADIHLVQQGGEPRPVRGSRFRAAGLGQDPHRLAHDPRRKPGAARGRLIRGPLLSWIGWIATALPPSLRSG